jgi:hypothetical protein
MVPHASSRFVFWTLVIVTAVFLAVYSRSFRVRPAADDFDYINEMHRGNQDGVLALFTRSVSDMTYRPLTSLGLWGFGNMFASHPEVGVRVVHLLSAIGYAAVAALWVRRAGLGRVGAVAALAIALLHPVLPAAVASIDGFNSLASSAMMWLGAWAILVLRERLLVAALVAVVCCIVGVGFKEYAFAMPLLAALTALFFWRSRRWFSALTLLLLLSGVVAGSIATRKLTLPPNAHGGWGYVWTEPSSLLDSIVNNGIALGSGLLFFGNTIWVIVDRSPRVMLFAAGWTLLLLITVLAGLLLRLSAAADDPEGEDPREIDPVRSEPRWILFLLLAIWATTFPAIVTLRVSEMYVPPMILPFALLCGFCADGFVTARLPMRVAAGAVTALAAIWSVQTIIHKVNGVVNTGARADRQIKQILAFLPPDAHDKLIGLRFLQRDRAPRDLYGVFRMPDSYVLGHPRVLDWPCPGKNLRVDVETYNDFDNVNMFGYDLVLGWDSKTQQFSKLGPR